MIDFKGIQKIHFVGIGGSGMSSLSELFLNQGFLKQSFLISGFDDVSSSILDYLEEKGVKLDKKGETSYLESSDLVVYSSAISSNHFQICRAQEKNITLIKRADVLGILLYNQCSFAIAGTHGKTTTTHLFAWVWLFCNRNPTVVAGAPILGHRTGYISGTSDQIIVEADEYDRSFLKLYPTYSIINNLEEDHLDCYQGYFNLEESFIQFIKQTKTKFLINADDVNLQNLISKLSSAEKTKMLCFGITSTAEYKATNITVDADGSSFLFVKHSNVIAKVWIPLLGTHNVMNVLGVLSFGHDLGLNINLAIESLKSFPGVVRRFEFLKNISKIDFYDDYAHHPKEVLETLRGVKKRFRDRRIVVVFQPHLYSRTQDFFKEFSKSLSLADCIFLAPIFPAREEKIKGVSSLLIHEEILKSYDSVSKVFDDTKTLIEALVTELQKQDLCLFMGAGNIRTIIAEPIMERISLS